MHVQDKQVINILSIQCAKKIMTIQQCGDKVC